MGFRTEGAKGRDMDSQRLAGILGAVVALLVIASVVIYGPRPGNGPKQAEKTQAPQAPKSST